MAGIQKERVIVPSGGHRHWVMKISGPDAPVLVGLTDFSFSPSGDRRAHSGFQLGLVHHFWTILGGILAHLIGLQQVFKGFHLWNSVQTEFLQIACERIN